MDAEKIRYMQEKFCHIVDDIREVVTVYVVIRRREYNYDMDAAEKEMLLYCEERYKKKLEVRDKKISLNKRNFVFLLVSKLPTL